jgi:hypothetical protein
MIKYFEGFEQWLEHPDNEFLLVCILFAIVSVVCCIKSKRGG